MTTKRSSGLVRVTGLVATLLLVAPTARAQQSFSTPEEAVTAIAAAVRAGNKTDLLKLLGKDGEDIISSGDEVADAATRQRFLDAYDAEHRVAMEGDDKAIMIVGKQDFPFPIPLVHKDGKWQFDTAAGRDEILFRRIGRNELDTIQACLAYVDAQNEYSLKDRGAGLGVYAQRVISTPGKKDGLYWATSQGEDASPLGAFVALATSEGYHTSGERQPFHGYYYKILTQQGPAAPGGELDYVVHGRMIGGFALVAYPAEYGNSGVMTFTVNHAGIVYQKDLGAHTEKLAEHINAFNPDPTWTKVDLPDEPQ